jgi:uncharacterized oxidoreductase
MKISGNTIFITGGGSGIGRGLAEALHAKGNKVIIGGRRRSHLDAVVAANPGMSAVQIDVSDVADIERAAAELIKDFPTLNVLINNAGIMELDHAVGRLDDKQLVSTITTNLIGPLRLTSALIDHIKTQPDPTVVYNSSVLAFVPLAFTAVYSATKAALHSYVLSQRFLLKEDGVKVLEIAPPCRSTSSSPRRWRYWRRKRTKSWSTLRARCATTPVLPSTRSLTVSTPRSPPSSAAADCDAVACQ